MTRLHAAFVLDDQPVENWLRWAGLGAAMAGLAWSCGGRRGASDAGQTPPPATATAASARPAPSAPIPARQGAGGRQSGGEGEGGGGEVDRGGGATAAGPGIRCGRTSCRAGTEVCCDHGTKKARCLDRRPGPEVFYFKDEVYTRDLWGWRRSDPRCGQSADYCDGSDDCPDGQRCCLDEKVSVQRCIAGKGARQVCPQFEICTAGSPCRTPNTVCREGRCVKADPVLSCGDKTCEGDTPICCFAGEVLDGALVKPGPGGWDPGFFSCVAADAACPPGRSGALRRLECMNRSDCLSGDHCCAEGWAGTRCTGQCVDRVCRGAGDCANNRARTHHNVDIFHAKCQPAMGTYICQ